MSPGSWLVLTYGVSRKRTHSLRIRLPRRFPGTKDAASTKTAELLLDAPQLFLPDKISSVESHELAQFEAALSPENVGTRLHKGATSHSAKGI